MVNGFRWQPISPSRVSPTFPIGAKANWRFHQGKERLNNTRDNAGLEHLARGSAAEYDKGMEPQPVKFPLGPLARIEAETFGEPGQRTFRLVVEAGGMQGLVWLEKEQLSQLGVYLQSAVQGLSREERTRRSTFREPPWSGSRLPIDFKARRVLVSHDQTNSAFYLQAHQDDEDQPDPEASSVSFWITTDQAEALAEAALRICAAGRPNCFLCGLPINPDGHMCPRSNGHAVLDSG